MEYGSTLRFEDPSDTLLKEALGDKKYSFMSYQLTTVDPMADPESPERTQQIDMTLGSELTITEEVTVNILVYIEEEASAPEAEPDPDVTDELPRLRAEYKQQADALASALVRRVSANDFKLTAEQQAEYVTKIRLALQEAVSAIDGKTTAAEMDEIIAALQEDLEAIEEEASRIAGVEIRLLVSGITAKTKTYDGTDSAELDLSGVVFIDKETNLVISARRAAEFVLTAEGRYDSPNAGSRTILVTLSLENADGFVLDATQIVIESEIFRARLTVSVDREGKPVFDGFVNGETEQVLSGEFHVGYEEKADGTRTAHPSGFSSENYDIVYLDVVFEAAPKASKLELILGITIPAAVLVAAAAVAAVILRKKKL